MNKYIFSFLAFLLKISHFRITTPGIVIRPNLVFFFLAFLIKNVSFQDWSIPVHQPYMYQGLQNAWHWFGHTQRNICLHSHPWISHGSKAFPKPRTIWSWPILCRKQGKCNNWIIHSIWPRTSNVFRQKLYKNGRTLLLGKPDQII